MAVLAEDEKFRNFIKENLRMRPVEFGMEEAKAYMAKASERFAKQAAAQ
jgi:hypothetical protein